MDINDAHQDDLVVTPEGPILIKSPSAIDWLVEQLQQSPDARSWLVSIDVVDTDEVITTALEHGLDVGFED